MKKWIKSPLLIALFPALVIANSQSPLQQVDWLLYQGQVEKAEHALKDIQTTEDNGLELGLLQARIEFASNDLDEAAERLEALITRHSKESQLHYWLGRVKGAQAQQASIFSAASYAKDSKNAFLTAVELDPSNVQNQRGLMQYYLNAPSIVGGSVKKAKQVASKIMELDKLRGTMSLFSIAREEKDDEQVAVLIKQLESEFKHSPTALYSVGIYYQQDEQFEKAYSSFAAAINVEDSKRPQDEASRQFDESKLSAMYQVGRNAVFSELHVAEGIAALNQYIETNTPSRLPSKEWAQFRLSKLYRLNDQATLAKPILLALKAETKDERLAKQVKKELKNL